MNKYAINEYEWVPFDEESDDVPLCYDCHYSKTKPNKVPCRGCEAIYVRDGYPRGRLYFKPKVSSQ